jgi:tRNA-binding protein
MKVISFEEFKRVDVRLGTVVHVEAHSHARKPAYILRIDFGPELGERSSSVQATNYTEAQLAGMQVVCVVNLPSRSIAAFSSEVLVLGVPGLDGQLALLTSIREAVCGGRVY